MLLIETELKASNIHGIGLFCINPIAKGDKVWAFHPAIDQVLDETALAALPAAMHTFINMYAYRSRETNQLILNLDLSRHMNHADQPTLVSDSDSNYFAKADLPAGTELTCNYRDFAIGACSAFLEKPSAG